MSDGKDHLWMAVTVSVLEIFLSLCPGLKIRHKYRGKKKKLPTPTGDVYSVSTVFRGILLEANVAQEESRSSPLLQETSHFSDACIFSVSLSITDRPSTSGP